VHVFTAATFLLASAPAWAQSLSPSAEESFKRAVQSRIEGVTVLSGTAGSSAGLFRWNLTDIDLSVSKLNGLGDVGKRTSLVDGPALSWNGILGGAIASFTAHNHFLDTPLEGNESRSSGAVVSFEGGAHLYYPAGLSSRVTLGLIYGRTKNEFTVGSPIGQEIVDAGLANWVIDSLTIAPSVDLAWKPHFGPFTFTPCSRYMFFRSEQLHSNSDVLNVTGNSYMWNNQFDVDYKSPLEIAVYPIHFGTQFNRFDLGGDLRGAFKTDYFYSAEFRVLAEMHGDLSAISFIGLCTTYFWSNAFSGKSWAIQVNLKF
jgi:hypothetical protein